MAGKYPSHFRTKYDYHTGMATSCYSAAAAVERACRLAPAVVLLAAPFAAWREALAVHGGPEEDWRVAARLGGLPVPAHELVDDEQRALWFSGYVQTYLERDLQALRAVENLADFRRLMRAACSIKRKWAATWASSSPRFTAS